MHHEEQEEDEQEEEEPESDDDNQSQTPVAGTASDSFCRQGNQGPPSHPTPDRHHNGGHSFNPPNQMDATTKLLQEQLSRLQEENEKMKSQLSTPRHQPVQIAQIARITPAKNLDHG
eukprot:scaffold15749_cov83-Cylindrotheca_fusiformis.AAC.1